LIDVARAEPVIVAEHGRPVLVVSVGEFDRMTALERVGDGSSLSGNTKNDAVAT
jgi:hypothetical protein